MRLGDDRGHSRRHTHCPQAAMTFRSVVLPESIPGTLWLASMPGRLETWDDFLAEARRTSLSRIVCLTPREEVTALSRPYELALRNDSLPCAWMHLPMHNFALSANAQKYRAGVDALAEALRNGEAALLHCAAGMGRTGTTAACVLKRLGLPSAEALQRVRDAGSNPESAAQSGLIDTF